jgi:uncharacterized membrane protein
MIAWLCSVRGLATLLVVSLAVNLFLGGLLVGRVTGQAVQESQTRRSIQAMLAPLPEAKRQLVRKEIGTAMPRVREQFAALQNARAALAGEMVKPVLDNAALERGFAAVQAHSMAIGGELQRAIVRAMPSLTQDERRAMVEALARRQTGGALPLP